MIVVKDLNNSEPYKIFKKFFESATSINQNNIEVICISSWDNNTNEVESRFVNLKYIINEDWIFFSNYSSKKAQNFKDHPQISALIYWNKLNVQIRMKAEIFKSSESFSDSHFCKRANEKNALAISSEQSQKIESYSKVVENYEKVLSRKSKNIQRPAYWGGYSFKPYYFEFWEGNDNRLNKRKVYSKNGKQWHKYFLQP